MNKLLEKNQIFIVGGYVRDKLLQHKAKDKDYLVIGSNTAEMLQLGFIKVGKDFPVFLHPINHEQYALARTEKKHGAGYYGFDCNTHEVTLEEDLKRRDLTINAMAISLATNELIDPYNGHNDLQKGILRHVSTAFSDDPVRLLRTARFSSQFGFAIANETMAFMIQIVASKELCTIKQERSWNEINKSLMSENPERFFIILKDINALRQVLPEANCLIDNPYLWQQFTCILASQLILLPSLDERIALLYYFIIIANKDNCHLAGKNEFSDNSDYIHYKDPYSSSLPLAVKQLLAQTLISRYSKDLIVTLLKTIPLVINFAQLTNNQLLKLITILNPINKQKQYNALKRLYSIIIPRIAYIRQKQVSPLSVNNTFVMNSAVLITTSHALTNSIATIDKIIMSFKLIDYTQFNHLTGDNLIKQIAQHKLALISTEHLEL